MAGLFFCLASAEGAGLLFCPATIQPNTSVYSVFCAINASIPPTPQNSTQGFTGAFLAILPIPPHTIPNRHNKPLHSLRHAGASASARTPRSLYQIPPPRRTLYRPAQTAYYNKVYKSASLLWINARRCSISQTMPAQRLTVWHPPPGGAVQQQGRGGRRGTIGGYRRISFRAFAR